MIGARRGRRNMQASDLPDCHIQCDEWPPAKFASVCEVMARYDCIEPAAVGCSWRVHGRYSYTCASVPELHEQVWALVDTLIDREDNDGGSNVGEFRARAYFHVYHTDARTFLQLTYERQTRMGAVRWRKMHSVRG